MRKYLLAASALAVASLPMAASAADMPATVTIGGRIFESIFSQSVTNQNPAGGVQNQSYNMQDYFRLYPAVDYTAPNGIHYGFKAEIRFHGGGGFGYVDRAFLFVKSDKMGKLTIGGQDGALEDAAVANDEAGGTGGWDGEYGFFGNGYKWLMPDTVANGTDGIKYASPSFGGLGVIASFIPDSTAQIGSDVFVNSLPAGTVSSAVKNRIEASLTYSGTFGGFGLNANLGFGSATPQATGNQNMSVIDFGLEGSVAGFTVGGNYTTGKFGPGFSALPTGFGNTSAYDAGVLYSIGAVGVGAQYYGYKIATAAGGAGSEKFGGEAIGAKYSLNPGVTLFFDGLVGQKQVTGASKVNFTGVGVGTYFQW